jgi:hypothetical protein
VKCFLRKANLSQLGVDNLGWHLCKHELQQSATPDVGIYVTPIKAYAPEVRILVG